MKEYEYVAAMAHEDYTTIHVKFPNSTRTYTYLASLGVQAGDHVVVHTDLSGFKVAEVESVDASPHIFKESPFSLKWIVQKIDLAEWHARNASTLEYERRAKALIANRRRRKLMEDVEEIIGETIDNFRTRTRTSMGK